MEHRLVDVAGIRLHLVEEGAGPLVLFVHGFPESWYSWRAQLPVVAAAGFRAVAMDVRGYGRSSRPEAIEAYRLVELAGDVAGVIAALGEESAVLVGHDWGSPIVSTTALLHPASVSAVALLSVPYDPPGRGEQPTVAFAKAGGEDTYYIDLFQAPGVAEAEIEPDVRGWLAGMYASVSGDTLRPGREGSAFFLPPGATMRSRFVTERPAWLGDEELAYYAGEFERTGLTGALNRYRNVDRDWTDLAEYSSSPLVQPALYVGGSRDAVTQWNRAAIEAFDRTLPALRGAHVLPGVGHWTQQEAPDEVNRLLLEFLGA